MINFLLILFCIVLYTLQTLFFKMYGDRYPGDPRYTTFVYATISGVVALLISFAAGGFSFEFDLLTFILGAINAAAYFFYYLLTQISSNNGPYSGVMVFSVTGGIALPILTSVIAFSDFPSIWKILCLLVIFISGYLVNKRANESMKNKKKFIISGFLLAIANGTYGSLINLQQAYTGESQKTEMLIYTFGIAAIFSFIYIILKNGRNTLAVYKQTKSSLIFLILAAAVAATAVNILVIIAKFIDINLLWTFCNSGVIVLSVIASAILFKEKLSRINLIGCAIIVVTLVLISYT